MNSSLKAFFNALAKYGACYEISKWLALLTRNSLFLLETRFSYSKLTFLTRNSLFYSKLAFLTRNSLFLLEIRFSYSELTFLTRNSHFLLETRFSYSKLTYLSRNSLFLLETRFSYSKLISLLETHFSYSKLTFLTRNSLPTKSESQVTKACSKGTGQMTKMAATPIYEKQNTSKISLKPKDHWHWVALRMWTLTRLAWEVCFSPTIEKEVIITRWWNEDTAKVVHIELPSICYIFIRILKPRVNSTQISDSASTRYCNLNLVHISV